tara:strand:- start:92 stop:730 length:639 start_codon:yes stop_codon:yes gene_type:complete
MINIITILNKDHKTVIYNFFKSMQNFDFSFYSIDEKINENNLINCFIIPENVNSETLNKIKFIFDNHLKQFNIFLLPLSIENEFNKIKFQKNNYNKINYPIKVKALENKLNSILSSLSVNYLHLSLNKNNFLINNLQNKKVFLTESEAEIVRLIFLRKTISKRTIRAQVLKLNPQVESKSLETHLYRLRKKFNKISSEISISSVDDNNLKLN